MAAIQDVVDAADLVFITAPDADIWKKVFEAEAITVTIHIITRH